MLSLQAILWPTRDQYRRHAHAEDGGGHYFPHYVPRNQTSFGRIAVLISRGPEYSMVL